MRLPLPDSHQTWKPLPWRALQQAERGRLQGAGTQSQRAVPAWSTAYLRASGPECQYIVEDHAGHQWTFSQTLADVAPEEWGGISVGYQD